MLLVVSAKAFHSLAGETASHAFALLHFDIHVMITQHPSIFQRTSVVPPDWPVLSLFWLKPWERLRDKSWFDGRALDEVVVLERQLCRQVTVGALLFASRKKYYAFLGNSYLDQFEHHEVIKSEGHSIGHVVLLLEYIKRLRFFTGACPLPKQPNIGYSWPRPCSFFAHSLWHYVHMASQLPWRRAIPQTSFVPVMTSQQLSLRRRKYFFPVCHSHL